MKSKAHGVFVAQLESGRPLYKSPDGLTYWYTEANGTPVVVLQAKVDPEALVAAVADMYGMHLEASPDAEAGSQSTEDMMVAVSDMMAESAPAGTGTFQVGSVVRLDGSYTAPGGDQTKSFAYRKGTIAKIEIAPTGSRSMAYVNLTDLAGLEGQHGLWCSLDSLTLVGRPEEPSLKPHERMHPGDYVRVTDGALKGSVAQLQRWGYDNSYAIVYFKVPGIGMAKRADSIEPFDG